MLSIGGLQPADALAGGAGERAFDMAEQLGLRTSFRWSRRGRPRPSAGRCAATGGGFRARRFPCRSRSRRGSGHWHRSARRGRSACARARIAGESPSSGVSAAGASSDARPRSVRASMRLRRSAAALRTVAASRSLLHGLATKSLAPALIASTAIETAPCAVMITTAASGSCSMISAEKARAPRGRRSRRARN